MTTKNLQQKGILGFSLFFLMLFFPSINLLGHCDSMDGPVIADARKAVEQNNVNYVLIWVRPEAEKELRDAFALAMNVRQLGPEAQQLADRYFFETLVRIHRQGEGEPFTGIKPAGTPIDEKILAADEAIILGNLSPLTGLIPEPDMPELRKRFDRVMALKNFDINDVTAGRNYVEAYVRFFHFAEGETAGHVHEHGETEDHLSHLPWILSGLFFLTSLLFLILWLRKRKS